MIDKFQDFFRVNKSIFSEMQDIWDKYEKSSKINLVVCGRFYSRLLGGWFHCAAMEGGEFTRIGRWWECKGGRMRFI